ncbi:hypothetical protein V6N12_067873 [Hibiscus sabdariffa]|uniref:Uncharacterized protein n=1 Tax=Hibiscus sabdariffa TaxID=183260 RepID=A0ABR2FP04_9ROSI
MGLGSDPKSRSWSQPGLDPDFLDLYRDQFLKYRTWSDRDRFQFLGTSGYRDRDRFQFLGTSGYRDRDQFWAT